MNPTAIESLNWSCDRTRCERTEPGVQELQQACAQVLQVVIEGLVPSRELGNHIEVLRRGRRVDPQPSNLDPQPSILDPQPSTLNPEQILASR